MYYGHDVALRAGDLELLIGLPPEQYRYERAFKLFQLQSAIIFPDQEKAKTDGWIIAAAKLLEQSRMTSSAMKRTQDLERPTQVMPLA